MNERPDRRRVLVVEDESDVTFIARLILEADGYAVAIAGSLREARASLRAGCARRAFSSSMRHSSGGRSKGRLSESGTQARGAPRCVTQLRYPLRSA
jgi:DNA-binding NtrC family response regulator